MKSKLTLHLDEDVKERAEQLADRRGTTISKIVEEHLQALLRDETAPPHADESSETEGDSPRDASLNTIPSRLPPRTRRMLDAIEPADESLDLDDDTRAWVDAAHEKHK